MRIAISHLRVAVFLAAGMLATSPPALLAQAKAQHSVAKADVLLTLSSDMRAQIHTWYADHTPRGVKPLPPGIRKRLARGKPLPPGIAKQVVPGGLRSLMTLPRGYDVVEVGVDVLLVEVATGIIHDVLMDVVR